MVTKPDTPYLSAAKSKIVSSDCAPTLLMTNQVDHIQITKQAAKDPLTRLCSVFNSHLPNFYIKLSVQQIARLI